MNACRRISAASSSFREAVIASALLDVQLHARLDHVERTLEGRTFLVGDHFSIADVSVLPRVAMYPWVQLPITPERYPNVSRWLSEVGARASLVESVGVRPTSR